MCSFFLWISPIDGLTLGCYPLHMSATRKGYDFDGVITHGVVPFGERCYIITGRSFEQAGHTYKQLAEKGIECAVYFHPSKQKDIDPESAARWKCDMIRILGIETFYEDSAEQIYYIKEEFPMLDVRHVVNGIAP